ncbi:hypothetical protein [Shouchella clausii]|uniref:Uncharacterized protein n=1 Tax=Shouchella clausii TaxID=79880 RepID=A0A268NUP1_SHOCL|nr:hypothetical protein [Shouchella clausii]PAE87227.1 hypothetical protein CHH72_19700 [Shouchella clausii]
MIFQQVGGVPQSIRIDNLSAAVVQTRSSKQETIYTDAFLLPRYSIQEIDQQLYELLNDESDLEEAHPYGVDWSKYDQLNRPWKQEEVT